MLGLATATSEISLVLFTTLAPSGAIALMIMALAAMLGHLSERAAQRVRQCMCIPLVVTMVGLVISATHLGSPSNALYAFSGVGRSPLSNEVCAAVLFLALSGSFWLYSFSRTRHIVIERVWLVAIIVSGALFIQLVSRAYSVETIITWDDPYMPVTLWLNAFTGGPVLAMLSLEIADAGCLTRRMQLILCGVSALALALSIIVLCLVNADLEGMRNSLAAATDLLPSYPAAIAGCGLLSAAGITLAVLSVRTGADAQRKVDIRRSLIKQVIACLLIFLGVFIIRFAFYMLHMTVGLGI